MGIADEIEALKKLKEDGTLSDEEFADAKARVIARSDDVPHQKAGQVATAPPAQLRVNRRFVLIGGAVLWAILVGFYAMRAGCSTGSGQARSSAAELPDSVVLEAARKKVPRGNAHHWALCWVDETYAEPVVLGKSVSGITATAIAEYTWTCGPIYTKPGSEEWGCPTGDRIRIQNWCNHGRKSIELKFRRYDTGWREEP